MGGVWLLMRRSVDLPAEETSKSLAEAFALRPNEVISIVGGGGKTSLMYAMARELSLAGKRVISTTTTRILEPTKEESSWLIIEEDEERLLLRLKEELGRHGHVTAVCLKPDGGKLKGLLPEMVDKIAALRMADYIINEADGAARKPIKAPNATEPVIPPSTTLVIAVVGMDALGGPLTQAIAFRPELITRLTGLPEGEIITTAVIASLLTHENGIIQYAPRNARIIPFINKAELAYNAAEVKNLATAIISRRNLQIGRVVSGSLLTQKPEFRIFEAA